MEIYNETMFDLLSTLSSSIKDSQLSSYQNSSMQVIEDDRGSVYVRGLSRHLAQNEEDALNMLFEVRQDILLTQIYGMLSSLFRRQSSSVCVRQYASAVILSTVRK